ncbi:MAG: nitrilase [Proteobacteria bacterium]|nr:nitrilase [Pseudomonadota bacterium]
MRVAIFQTRPELMNLEANLEEVIEKIHRGREGGARLCLFPELALTGYFVGPRYHEVALKIDSPQVRRLAEATRGTAAVVGFIEESPNMNFYNSALVAVDGQVLFTCRKLNLPNYGVFEEGKIFSPGRQVPVFKIDELTLAVFICNDLWHPSLPYLAVSQEADVLIGVINSSEEALGKEFSNIESWEIINKFYARVFGVYGIMVNRVGVETCSGSSHVPGQAGEPDKPQRFDCHFWGGSEMVDPFGRIIAKAAHYENDQIFGYIEKNLLRRKKIALPYLREDDPFFTHRQLENILFGPKVGPGN